jgi:phytol kinase
VPNYQIAQILPLWVSLVLILLYLLTIVVLAEFLSRLGNKNPEITRKIVHIGSGNVILLAWWLEIPAKFGIIAAIVAGCIALVAYFIPILPSINSVGRQSLGTFFYAVSIGVLIAWFWPINHPEYAAIGILIMTWGDGLAAIIGQNFGSHPYQLWGMTKSWEGSLTMFLVSWLITNLILGCLTGFSLSIFLVAVTIAVVATFLEAFSQWGIDNLSVPLGSAFLGFLLLSQLEFL